MEHTFYDKRMIKEETRTPEGFSVSSQEYHDICGERDAAFI